MKIHVTQEDIDRGIALSCLACPVARAVQRYVGTSQVEAYGFGILAFDDDYHQVAKYHTPRSVMQFMRRFDAHGSVRPFAFLLREVGWG